MLTRNYVANIVFKSAFANYLDKKIKKNVIFF